MSNEVLQKNQWDHISHVNKDPSKTIAIEHRKDEETLFNKTKLVNRLSTVALSCISTSP